MSNPKSLRGLVAGGLATVITAAFVWIFAVSSASVHVASVYSASTAQAANVADTMNGGRYC
jgi:hypothetical protein